MDPAGLTWKNAISSKALLCSAPPASLCSEGPNAQPSALNRPIEYYRFFRQSSPARLSSACPWARVASPRWGLSVLNRPQRWAPYVVVAGAFSPHLGEVPRALGRVVLVCAGMLRRENMFDSILLVAGPGGCRPESRCAHAESSCQVHQVGPTPRPKRIPVLPNQYAEPLSTPRRRGWHGNIFRRDAKGDGYTGPSASSSEERRGWHENICLQRGVKGEGGTGPPASSGKERVARGYLPPEERRGWHGTICLQRGGEGGTGPSASGGKERVARDHLPHEGPGREGGTGPSASRGKQRVARDHLLDG